MKLISKLRLIILINIFFFFLSCQKRVQYPIIPFISFESFQIIQSDTTTYPQGLLKFSVTDGDGDIGLNPNDTIPPYDYDMYSVFYKKHNGVFAIIVTPAPVAARIPYLTPIGTNKELKADVEVTIPLPLNDGKDDTIYFITYIFDRAMHKSKTITTPEFILK